MSDAPEADSKGPAKPPPLKPATVLDSIFRDDGPMPPARFGIRLLAFVMDAVLALGVSMVILKFSLVANYPDAFELLDAHFQASQDLNYAFEIARNPEQMDPALMDVLSYIFTVIIMTFWFYFAVIEALLGGTTLGKRTCRLKTISTINLSNPTIFSSMVRGGLKTAGFFFFGIFGWAAILIPLFLNKRRQMGHDMLSRTVVVDERKMAEQQP
ncbi:MAG: RDD family protein [Coraliomargarita sp.]